MEDPGPWERRAFEDCPHDPGAGRAIAERTRGLGQRPLFIRRYSRRGGRSADRERAFAFVDAASGTATWSTYTDLAEIAQREWVATERLREPLYLVCTHGRHDQCCAILGRPVAEAFAALRPEATWECSHLGGDRFAGNVLVLPWGITYGFVTGPDVRDIVRASERGDVEERLLRGFATDRPEVQAARTAAIAHTGIRSITGLVLADSARVESGGPWRVSFATTGPSSGDRVVVDVVQHRVADARATCAHREPVAMREWRATIVSG